MNSRSLATPQDPRADSGANPDKKPRRRSVKAPATSEGNAGQKLVETTASVTIAEFGAKSNPATSPIEHIEYNDHVLKVEPQRGGWKVTVFPKGSPFALHRIAYTSEFTGRDIVIAQAKAMVDAESPKEPAPAPAPAPAPTPEQTDAIEALSGEIEKTVAELGQMLLRWGGKAVSMAKRVYFSIDAR